MRLIDNDGVVLHQQTILLDLRQQDTVGHQLNHGVFADVVAEADFIADAAARLALQLFGNTVGDGSRGQTTRLSMADESFQPAAQLHADFGQLGGFTRTGLPGDDHHLVVAHRLENLLFFLANRQVFRIGDGRTRRFAQQDFTGCLAYLLRHLLKDGLLRFRIFNLLHAVQTAGKARFVAQHQAVELLIKLGEGDFLLFCHSVIGQSSAGKISFEVLP